MLVALIGNKKIHKLILPQVPSGIYTITDDSDNSSRKLVEIEAKDGKWQIMSDTDIKILNPNYVDISEKGINIKESSNLFLTNGILKEYSNYELYNEEEQVMYILCCLPAYEDNWQRLSIKSAQEILIGRANSNLIVYNNNLISNVHARIVYLNGRYYIENFDKNYGVFVNNHLVYNKSKFLFNGDVIFIMGLRIILMGDTIYINNSKQIQINEKVLTPIARQEQKIMESKEDKDKKYVELYQAKDYFYRAPKISNKFDNEKIIIDPPPARRDNERMPAILTVGSTASMGLISLVSLASTISGIASGTYGISESILSLITSFAMILCTLLIPLMSMKWEKKRDRKYEKKRQVKYKEYLNQKRNEIREVKENKRKILFENYATTEECIDIILNKGKRLWERTTNDTDFLTVNLGIGDVPANLDVSYPSRESFSIEKKDNLREMLDNLVKETTTLKDAPATISLAHEKIIAYIDANKNNVHKFMQGLFIQLMALHSYHDLKFVFLVDENESEEWEYAKMFPYAWDDEKTFRFFEDKEKNMDEVSKLLEDEFNRRLTNKDGSIQQDSDYKNFSPYYLIITDNYRKIENLKIVSKIFETPQNLGFSIFCITDDIMKLPNECKTFIGLNGNQGKIFHNELLAKDEINFTFNNITTYFFENIEKVISNIPIKYKLTEKNSLPEHYTFLEMYNVGLIEQLNILDRWQSNDSTLSLAVPIGVKSSGKLLNLDIHEKYHGPHGIIAGSTGSGKSEFIITYILSLAINFHPDDVTFVLIDYKGGGLAGAFKKQDVKLPHLVGTITNIDKEGLQRSLVSIQSELKRRQILFNEAREITDGGVIDIYKYQKLYHDGQLEKPIPHLLIICDEFAELKQQQPDFMEELVSVSRIGRSLGVHLILATQKPSGIVDDQIRSNSKFAICLKVQDRSDSSDVIGRDDAAYIRQAGRFYIKVGNDDYFDIGQSGWSGAEYYPSDTSKTENDDSIKFISNTGNVIKKINTYEKKTVEKHGEQLTNIVKYLDDLAKESDIEAEQLWLDDIPEKIYVKDIKEKYGFKKKLNSILISIGEYDAPAEQKQGIVNLDLTKNGNVIIYGNAESGKETLLSTIAYDLIKTYSTDEVWLYLLDFGTESLKIFQDSKHVGEVIFVKDKEKLERFFARIKEIVKKRKQILSNYNGSYNFYIKTSKEPMPLITIVINGYDSFYEHYEDDFDDLLLTLTREGLKSGVVFIMTTTTSNDLRYRMSQNFRQKIALSLNDVNDYSNIFDRIGARKPAQRFGRGLVNLGEEVFDFQTAKACEPEDYNIFIKDQIEKSNKNNQKSAEKIPILPDVVKLSDLKIKELDLANFPIGLRRKDIKVEVSNFKDNFINVMVSKDIDDVMQFATNIIMAIKNIKDVNVIILDPEKKILSSKNDLSDNYKQLMSIKNKQKSSTFNICFILGLDKFMNYLEKEAKLKAKNKDDDDDDDNIVTDGAELFEKIINHFKENNNIDFVLVDSSAKIKEHNYDDWYSENVIPDSIIWVGNGIDDQYILEVNATRKEINDNCSCAYGYVNKKGKTVMLKLLEMKEKRDEDE